jgi:hypothetical protein
VQYAGDTIQEFSDYFQQFSDVFQDAAASMGDHTRIADSKIMQCTNWAEKAASGEPDTGRCVKGEFGAAGAENLMECFGHSV